MAGGYFSTSGSGGYFGGGVGSGGSGISPTQAAEVAAARAKKPSNSILGDLESSGKGLFHGSTSALGAALGYLMRPVSAVDTGLTDAAKAGDNFDTKTFKALGHGFMQGIEGKKHDTFSDYIRAEYPKFAAHHKTSTALLGFAGSIATDPTLPLILGAQFIPGVDVAVDSAEAARLSSILGTAATSTARAQQAQDALAAIEKAVGPATEKAFGMRKAVAQLHLAQAQREIDGLPPDLVLDAKLATTAEGARVESEQALRKVIQAKYSIPFSGGKAIPLTPTMIGGRRVAPLVPSLARTAGAGIPGVSKAADALGQMFKHGWGSEEFSKPQLAATTKAKQLVQQTVMHAAFETMGPHFKTLTSDEMRKALNFGETRQGIVQNTKAGRTINEKMLAKAERHGELSGKQVSFLRDWHHTMEGMRSMEAKFGVTHEGDIGNIVYVPHRYLREGGQTTKVALATKFGLSRERQNLTLDAIEAAMKNGRGLSKGLDIVTNPEEILGRRAAESAHASTQMLLADVISHTMGVPSKIPNLERRALALKRVRSLKKKQRGLTHIVDMKGSRRRMFAHYGVLVRKETKAILDKRAKKLDTFDERIAHHMSEAAKPHIRPPTFSKARGMKPEDFKKATAHFSPEDRKTAITLHATMARGRGLEGRLTRLGKPKGGPQKAAKALALDVEKFSHDVAHLHGRHTIEDIQAMGVDRSKENIRYVAQPQGKMTTLKPEDTGYTGATLKPKARGESWRGNIKTRLDAERTNLAREYESLTKKYATADAFDHGKAINRIMKQRDRHMTETARQIDAAKERLRVRKVAAEAEWHATFDRQARLHTSWERQITKEQRAYGALKNNDQIPHGWIELDKKLSDGKYHFAPEIHDALTNQEAAFNNKNIMRSLSNGWMKLMRRWKIGVTSVNPGYRGRNTASDIWNMYIAGVPTPRIVQYGYKAQALQRLAHTAGQKLARGETDSLTKSEIQALRDLNEMQLHGILSGLFQGDIQEVGRMFHEGTRARDYLAHGINPVSVGKMYVKATQDWNRHIENWGRVTHYLYRRQYQHMSAVDASQWVKKAHFDYEELTPFEQKFMKSVFPFYTWTRKDIPYQLSQMVSRPGKYATFPKAIETSNELATGNPHTPDENANIMPSWMKHNYMFRVPGFGKNAYINPNIGVQDLSSLEHPISQGLAQHINPVAQIATAVLTGKNPGTGQDIVGTHPRNPVSGFGADILRFLPGANVGPTERTVRGQTMEGTGANPWYTYAAQQIPLINTVVNQQSSIKKAQRGGGNLSALGYLTGLGVFNRDPESEATSAQLNFQDDMKKIVRGLRDTGQLAPSKPKKLSAFQMALNELITKGG